jgi:hypothetical protein
MSYLNDETNSGFIGQHSIELEYDEYDYVYRYNVYDVKNNMKLIACLEDKYCDVATEKVDFLMLELSLV